MRKRIKVYVNDQVYRIYHSPDFSIESICRICHRIYEKYPYAKVLALGDNGEIYCELKTINIDKDKIK